MSTMSHITTLHAILTLAQAGQGTTSAQATATGMAWLGLLPAVVGLIAGLTLWAAGGKLLKFGVILLGITLGGLLGLLLGSLAGASGAIVGVLIGTIAGGIAAGVFYRFAVGLTFGVGCGLAAAVVGLAVAGGGSSTRNGATSANFRPILPAAAAIISEEDDPEDQPNGIGGAEQPLTAPPAPLPPPAEVPDDLGPNPSDVEEPATEPAPPKKPARPAAKPPAKPAAKDARPATRTAAPANQANNTPERRNAANRQGSAPKADPDFPGGPADGDGPPPPRPRTARPDAPPPATTTAATRRNTIYLDEPAEPTDVLSRLNADLQAWWHNTGALGRSWAIGAGVIGLLAGTLVGMILPAKAASVLTAAAGSALWMICGLLLAHAASLPWPRADIVSPLAWVLIWVVITFIGVALQAGLGTGKVAKKAKGEASKARPKVAKG